MQRGAVCCSVLQRVAVWCSVVQFVAVWCSVVQCVAVRCSVVPHIETEPRSRGQTSSIPSFFVSLLLSVAVWYNVL